MTVMYMHLEYEDYKGIEDQMKAFSEIETSHRTEGGFYHKSVRIKVDKHLTIEFHGPLVGGYGHRSGD